MPGTLGASGRPAVGLPSPLRDEPPRTSSHFSPRSLRGSPDRPHRGRRSLSEGNLLQTEELLRRAAAGAPDDLDIALDLGDTLNRLGRNESAREHYLKFLARHPSASQARRALGLTLMTLGSWGEARDQFQILVREHPRDPAALRNLGLALNRLARYEDALPPLKEAAALSPGHPEIETELGIACLRLDRLPEAEAALRKAVEIDPSSVPALHNLGNCYARMGRTQEAREILERFTRASNRQEHFYDEKRLFRAAQARAGELSRAGKEEKALAALLAYRDQLEGFPSFHQELGITYLRLGKSPEATRAFQRALDLDPGLVEARANLIALYQQAGETERAMKLREAAARQTADARTAGPP